MVMEFLRKDALKAEFSLYYPANDAIRQSLAISVADMMKPLGINIKVEGASWDIIGQKCTLTLFSWAGEVMTHMKCTISIAVKYAGVDYYNTGFYKNETVDEYFEQALQRQVKQKQLSFGKKHNGMEQLV